jgi:hypothetical protein
VRGSESRQDTEFAADIVPLTHPPSAGALSLQVRGRFRAGGFTRLSHGTGCSRRATSAKLSLSRDFGRADAETVT